MTSHDARQSSRSVGRTFLRDQQTGAGFNRWERGALDEWSRVQLPALSAKAAEVLGAHKARAWEREAGMQVGVVCREAVIHPAQ